MLWEKEKYLEDVIEIKMRNIFSILILICLISSVKANSIYIELKVDGFAIAQNELCSAKNKCLLINIRSEAVILDGPYSGFRPLILFKVFSQVKKTILQKFNYSANTVRFDSYLKETVLPKLAADLYLGVTDLGQNKSIQNINTFDSLIIYNSGKYEIYTGVVCAEFFNLIDFEQFHVMQSNQTIINTLAKTIKVDEWQKDSLPSSDEISNEPLCPKIYLLNKKDSIYIYFKYYYPDEDSPLAFYREYVYKKDFGIIAFKSKYLYRIKDEYRNEIVATDEYYYFR